jgi:uncharacterized protein (DUF433 family)
MGHRGYATRSRRVPCLTIGFSGPASGGLLNPGVGVRHQVLYVAMRRGFDDNGRPEKAGSHLNINCRSVDTERSRRYAQVMDYNHLITIEPGKRSGKPCIRGLRITVTDVLEYLAAGMSVEQIIDDFPDLTAEDIRACLAFAADRERRLCVVPPG